MKRIGFLIALLALLGIASAQTNIEFWYAFSDEPRSNWIQDRIAEYNQTLEAAGSPYRVTGERKGSYTETLQAAVLAARQGNPPHLAQLFEVGSQLAVDSGIFEPIGNLGGINEESYIKPVINYYTINGAVNSIPFNSSSPVLYANKQLMAKTGITKLPETFSEVIDACETIAASGVDTSCITFPLHGWLFEQWMANQGALLGNHDNGRSGRVTETYANSSAAMAIGEFLSEIGTKGYYQYTGKQGDWGGSDAIFYNQNVVFHITSTSDAAIIPKNAKEEHGFDVVIGKLPIADGIVRNGVVIGGASVWVLKDHPTAEKEIARDFILYMTNAENMISWHKLTGYYPVRTESVSILESQGWFKENPNLAVAFDQLLETVPNAATAGALMGSFLDTRSIIQTAMEKIITGTSARDALNEAKELADAKVAEYNANFK